MRRGKYSVILGLAALAIIVTVELSRSNYDGITGPLTNLITSYFSSSSTTHSPEMRSVGFFALYEKNIQYFMTIAAILMALSSGFFAVLASKIETNSLWYSLGLLSGATALVEIHRLGGLIFLVIIGFWVLKCRNGKMTSF